MKKEDLFFYIVALLVLYSFLDTSRFYSTTAQSIHNTFDNNKRLEFAEKINVLAAKLQKKGLDVQKDLGRFQLGASIVQSVVQLASSFRG